MPKVLSVGEALLESAGRNTQRLAFVTDSLAMRIGDLLRVSASVCRMLAESGVRPGDRVMLWADGAHSLEWIAGYFAIHLHGAWCVPLNPKISEADAQFYLGDLEPAALLAPAALIRRERPNIWARAGMAPARILGLDLRADGGRACIGEDAIALTPTEPPRLAADGGDIIYTTGTTGRAKGVVLPSRTEQAIGARYAAAQDLGPGSVIHSPIPLFTASAIMTLTLPMVAADATFSIDYPFDPARSLERARRRGCTVFKAVPAHYLLIGTSGDIQPVESVKLAITTAAPLSATGFEHIRRFFPQAKIRALFGSTESGGAFTIIEEAQLRRSLGSLGAPAPDCAIELQDKAPDGAGGEEGDLVLRGPFVADGYWRRSPEIVAATFLGTDRVRTGDRAARVGEDYVLRGRTSSVINRGGFKIDPGEIEAVVNKIPWVEDSCVVPVAHDVLGEDLLLVVQAQSGGVALDDDRMRQLAAVLDGALQGHKRPRQVLSARLDRNALGKIDRKEVRRMVDAARADWRALPGKER